MKGILDGQIPAETTTSNGAVGQKARPPGGGDKDVSPLSACCVVPAAIELAVHKPLAAAWLHVPLWYHMCA